MSIVYISIDVEMEGDTPMLNNMLSIGMIAITDKGDVVWKYETGFEPLKGHEPMKEVMEFWSSPKQSEAWKKVNKLPKISVLDFFNDISRELTELKKKYIIKFVGKPSSVDWMFFKCYYELGKKESNGLVYGTKKAKGFNIGFKCYDISELFNAFKLINGISDTNKSRAIEKELSGKQENLAHDALYDATCQGLMYIRLLKIMKSIKPEMSIESQLIKAKQIKLSEKSSITGGKNSKKNITHKKKYKMKNNRSSKLKTKKFL